MRKLESVQPGSPEMPPGVEVIFCEMPNDMIEYGHAWTVDELVLKMGDCSYTRNNLLNSYAKALDAICEHADAIFCRKHGLDSAQRRGRFALSGLRDGVKVVPDYTRHVETGGDCWLFIFKYDNNGDTFHVRVS